MSANGGAEGKTEAWTKRQTLVADWEFWQIWEGDRPIADFLLEPDADTIIANRAAAEALEEATAALDVVSARWHDTQHQHSSAWSWKTCPFLECREAREALTEIEGK